MKFVAISDTHGIHEEITDLLPDADCIIFAGDMSKRGGQMECEKFLQWYSKLPYTHKILIAGNHDWFFQQHPDTAKLVMPSNITYLQDSMTIINGIKIWGSPVQPEFHNWAFNRFRGDDIRRHWKMIPEDTDILVTHGPVYGIGDRTWQGLHVGCQDLWETVNLIKPKVCIAGHIHEGYGVEERMGIKFINACQLDERYQLINKPILFEL
jgi:Icc-related predicted phosphoesterase